MRHYILSVGQALDYKHDAPERTAYRSGTGMNFDRYYQVWPNRISMVKTIRLQQRGERNLSWWTPVIPLRETEGY